MANEGEANEEMLGILISVRDASTPHGPPHGPPMELLFFRCRSLAERLGGQLLMRFVGNCVRGYQLESTTATKQCRGTYSLTNSNPGLFPRRLSIML